MSTSSERPVDDRLSRRRPEPVTDLIRHDRHVLRWPIVHPNSLFQKGRAAPQQPLGAVRSNELPKAIDGNPDFQSSQEDNPVELFLRSSFARRNDSSLKQHLTVGTSMCPWAEGARGAHGARAAPCTSTDCVPQSLLALGPTKTDRAPPRRAPDPEKSRWPSTLPLWPSVKRERTDAVEKNGAKRPGSRKRFPDDPKASHGAQDNQFWTCVNTVFFGPIGRRTRPCRYALQRLKFRHSGAHQAASRRRPIDGEPVPRRPAMRQDKTGGFYRSDGLADEPLCGVTVRLPHGRASRKARRTR